MSQATRRPIAARPAATRRPAQPVAARGPGLLARLRGTAGKGTDAGQGKAPWPEGTGGGWSRRLLAACSLAAALVMVAGVASMVRDWQRETPIRQVVIAGDLQQVQRPDLQAALERTVRGSFFTANLHELQAVALRFPWVATARVSRQWPDAVRVEIEEKQAVARWGADGLVSRQGEVFRPRAARGTDMLPVLQAPRAQAGYVLQQYQAMDALLRRVGLRIHRLELTDRMSWVLTLDGSVRVLVDAQDTLAKLERFTLLYDRQLSNEVANIASIDLRYRNGVAIGWRRAG